MEGGISHFATAERRKEREKEFSELFSLLIKSRCQGTSLGACLTQHNCFLVSALVESPFVSSSSISTGLPPDTNMSLLLSLCMINLAHPSVCISSKLAGVYEIEFYIKPTNTLRRERIRN